MCTSRPGLLLLRLTVAALFIAVLVQAALLFRKYLEGRTTISRSKEIPDQVFWPAVRWGGCPKRRLKAA